MARTKRPRKIGSHTHEQMKSALQLINEGMKIRRAAKVIEIPYTTLRRYFNKLKNLNEEEVKEMNLTPNYYVNRIFSEEQETILKNYLKDTACSFYGLTYLECRKLVYKTATLNNLKVPECWHRGKIAGIEWMRSFRSRHHDLHLGASEKITTPVQGTLPEAKQFLLKTSEEREALICANEQDLPPVIVFPRTNLINYNTIEDAHPVSLDLAAPSGWMNSHLSNESLPMAFLNRTTPNFAFGKDEIDIEKKVLHQTLIKAIPKLNNINQLHQESLNDSLWSCSKQSKQIFGTEGTTKRQKYFRSFHADSFLNDSCTPHPNKIQRRKTGMAVSLSYMRAVIEATAKGDGFTMFGKQIAQKLRNNKKDEAEINIAKLLIDNVLQNLSIGIYNA